jgi:hypothetical protein
MSTNSLVCLPCLDSLEMGLARQRDLDIPRHIARALGESAVKAVTVGEYQVAGKELPVNWSALVKMLITRKKVFRLKQVCLILRRMIFLKHEYR